MKHFLGRSWPAGAAILFGIAGILFPGESLGQHRMIVEPSLEIAQLHDNNLFYSADDPASDLILRVAPSLAVRIENPRWLVSGSYGLDSERFATHQNLDTNRARERGQLNLHYRADPRLELGLDCSYIDTATAAELNAETGMAAARMRARSLSFRPSLHYRISPRVWARAAHISARQSLADGTAMREDFATLGFERQLSPRDRFMLDYQQGQVVFDFGQRTTTDTYLLRAGWSRDLDARTRLELRAGPRITDGSPAPELSASLTRQFQFSSMTLSFLQTQTTVVGQPGIVDTRNVQASFTYRPFRSLQAYAAPTVFRSTKQDLEAVVYRVGVGATYALTPLLGIDLSYRFDRQEGVLDPLRANEELSHGTLLVALKASGSGR